MMTTKRVMRYVKGHRIMEFCFSQNNVKIYLALLLLKF